MKHILATLLVLTAAGGAAHGASLTRTYSYFTVGGSTLETIEKELGRRGPKVESTGMRHPGATEMRFFTDYGLVEKDGRCRVAKATVTVKAKIILPRWTGRKGADRDTRLIWDTLAADIKRHEESHALIAKSHARDLETAMLALPAAKSCTELKLKAEKAADKVLAAHDKAQSDFDRIEGKSFERRLIRLLQYRLERDG